MLIRALVLLLLVECPEAGGTSPVTFTGTDSNAYLILGEREALLVDTTERRTDVAKLADLVAKSGRKLTTIFITHAHGDHFLGLAQLLERFPEAKAVTTAAVVAEIQKNEIRIFSSSSRTLGDEGPKRLVIPQAIAGDSLQFEGRTLRVVSFDNGESGHAAALFDPESGDLFAGDLVYSGTHLNFREKRLDGWRAQLQAVERWAKGAKVKRIFPGHGPVGDRTLFAENRRYIDDFKAALETPNREHIRKRMLARYPRHRQPQNLEASIRTFVLMPDD